MGRYQLPSIRVFFMICQLFVITAKNCGSESSVYGMMLRGHIFKTLQTEDSLECVQECNTDKKCQSINYAMFHGICELNDRTKEARPEDFVADIDRLYMRRWAKRVPLGSIPELPAVSCGEIKHSEGAETVSGMYWLYSDITPGEVRLVHCDMSAVDDIDECQSDLLYDCHSDALCQNMVGSYKCVCRQGFVGDGKTSCIPADLAEGCTGYKWLTDADRHHSFAAPQIKCDRNDITEKSWYRFGGDSGTQMLTTCIPPYHCNTHAPGWLFNGTHPEMYEGIVQRRVCFHWSNNCCYFKTDINVRNCGSFYAYELGPPTGCWLRYCGE
ncbi:uromodulin-like [Oculina patagonica]